MWDASSLETMCVIGVDYFEDAVFALAFSNKVNTADSMNFYLSAGKKALLQEI